MINHLMSILISIFLSGYHGKTTDFAKNSSATELQLPISSTLEIGMNVAFRYIKTVCH